MAEELDEVVRTSRTFVLVVDYKSVGADSMDSGSAGTERDAREEEEDMERDICLHEKDHHGLVSRERQL